MLDGDEVYQKTMEDEAIEIRKMYMSQQDQEMYADYQTSKKGRAKKNDDKIFNREDDITNDKNAILKKPF